jgi:type IV secretory pathway protease TraF
MLFGKRYFGHILAKKDIVVFENPVVQAMTEKKYGSAAGLVKRVIALAGDIIQIRGGQVIVNGKIITKKRRL